MLHLDESNSVVCILGDSPSSISKDNNYAYINLDKFVICTNNKDHKFATESHEETMVLLHTTDSAITRANNNLVNYAQVSFKYILSSQAIVLHVLSCLLIIPSQYLYAGLLLQVAT